MKVNHKYQVEVLDLNEVNELPGAWSNADFIKLLNLIEYDDVASISPEELKEMTAMALSDLEPEEAAVKILELRFGDQLSKGQRQNLSEELKEERLWEEYAKISDHEELFNIGCILYWAFPKKFPEPEIVEIKLKVNALNSGSTPNLQKPTASFIARLLNDGMNDHNTIYRLFDENIKSNSFPEAEHIIWKFEGLGYSSDDLSNTFTIYTSWNWVDELKGVRKYESTAFSDGQLN
jgi:hypothetical protein